MSADNQRYQDIEPRIGWERVVCVASGPSFDMQQANLLRNCCALFRLAVVNGSWERLPHADLLYSCEEQWWDTYHAKVVAAKFAGEKWTFSPEAAKRYGLSRVHVVATDRVRGKGIGMSKQRDRLHAGGNSGFQLVNLVVLFGAREIVLVGYDMQRDGRKTHWHGDHPKGLQKTPVFEEWVANFDDLAADLTRLGVKLVNCSKRTAIKSVARSTLESELANWENENACAVFTA